MGDGIRPGVRDSLQIRCECGTQFDPVVVWALCAEVDGAQDAARSAAVA